jgi:flagellar protein FliS
MDYLEQSLAVQSSMELVVALYDGMLRFLHQAIACVESGDANGRRQNIKYTLEILTYLQGRMRADAGAEVTTVLSEFYAAMYSQCVLASRDASIPLLEETIRNIRTVRDAWKQAASSNDARSILPREQQTPAERLQLARPASTALIAAEPTPMVHRWSA